MGKTTFCSGHRYLDCHCFSTYYVGYFPVRSFCDSRNEKTHIVLYIVMSVAVVAYSTFSYISTHQFYDISSSSRITKISFSDLNQIREQKETGLIYIGRDGCRYCDSIYPNLEIFTATQKTEIKYYNTNTDRETNKAEMDKV